MAKKMDAFNPSGNGAFPAPDAPATSAAPSTPAAPAEKKWPRPGPELNERIAVAVRVGALKWRDLYHVLNAMHAEETAVALALLAFEDSIDLRDDRFTFKALQSTTKTAV